MAIKRYSSDRFVGLSTDSKPTALVPDGALFHESDTLFTFLKVNDSWELTTASGYATQTWVLNQDYVNLTELTTTSGDIVTQIPSLTGYATETWVTNQNYVNITELTTTSGDIVSQIPSLAGYATESWVNSQGFITLSELTTTSGDIVAQIPSLTGYATETWVTNQNYVNQTELTTASGDIVSQIPSLTGYATETWVTNQNYVNLTELTTTSGDIVSQIPSLAGYATQSWVSSGYIDNSEMTTISGDIIAQVTSASGVAAGSDTEVQYNDSGVLGASSNLTWDGTTLKSIRLAQYEVAADVNPTILTLTKIRGEDVAGSDNDYLGQISFYGHNDAVTPEDIEYGRIRTRILDASDGTEDGIIYLGVIGGGSLNDSVMIRPSNFSIGYDDITARFSIYSYSVSMPSIKATLSSNIDSAQTIKFMRYRGYTTAGQDNDYLTDIGFWGYNDAGTPEEIEYARISTQIQDASDGTELGTMWLMPLGTGANPGVIKLARKYAAATGSDNDYITRLSFVDYNDNVSPEEIEYARISTQILDASDGTEDGLISFSSMMGGSLTAGLNGFGDHWALGTTAQIYYTFDVSTNIQDHGTTSTMNIGNYNYNTSRPILTLGNYGSGAVIDALVSRVNNANAGVINLTRRRMASAGQDNDYLTDIRFNGYNDNATPEQIEYARISTQIMDASDGTEDGNFRVHTVVGGSLTQRLLIGQGFVNVNDRLTVGPAEGNYSAKIFTSHGDGEYSLYLNNYTNTAAAGVFRLERHHGFAGNGQDDDYIFDLNFLAHNDAAENIEFARFSTQIIDANDGIEHGRAFIQTMHSGSLSTAIDLIGNTFALNSGSAVNAILDQDDFSSNSDTALATQQSIKTYVDNQIATVSGGGSEVARIHGTGNFSTDGYNINHNIGSLDHTTNITIASTESFNEYETASVGNIYVKIGYDIDIVYNTGGVTSSGIAFYWESLYDAPYDGTVLRGTSSFSVSGTELVHDLGIDHFTTVIPAGTSTYNEEETASIGVIYIQVGSGSDMVYNTGGETSDGLSFYWEISN